MSAALPFLLLALSQPPAAPPAEGHFTLELSVSPETPEGRRLIASTAARLCPGRHPHLGRYTYKGTESLPGAGASAPRFEVRQAYICADAPQEAPEGERLPADWRPSPDDEARVRALTDAGDAAAIHALWSDANREMEPLSARASALARFRQQAGKPLGHRIAKVTWYVNPEGGVPAGAYAAVDYERRYSGLLLDCGFLAWYRRADGQYELVRQENGSVPRSEDIALSAEALAELRTAWRCPAE